MRCVVGGYAHLDTVSNHDLDPELFHSTGKYASYGDIVITFDFHCAATEDPGDHAFQLDQIFSTQNAPFPAQRPKVSFV